MEVKSCLAFLLRDTKIGVRQTRPLRGSAESMMRKTYGSVRDTQSV
jgi:hypothetical protein